MLNGQDVGPTAMLAIDNLGKTYSGSTAPALDRFTLSVGRGQFVSLIGPSGCGKTTVLRIVAGLLEPSTGTVMVDGALSVGPSREKAIVFQLFNLFPWRTALANVAYGLELQGIAKADRLATAREYLELVGLGHRARHYPAQLSGGEAQRVGLARALAMEPKLLLMDEPFGSVDALNGEYLRGMVQDICSSRDLTVLMVTHSVDEAIFLSDRIVLMGVPGCVLTEETVSLARPRSGYDWKSTSEYQELRRMTEETLQREFVKSAVVS
jgi:NitT/TauT family transport system ATP-binding protein